jgi:hypothetical protein
MMAPLASQLTQQRTGFGVDPKITDTSVGRQHLDHMHFPPVDYGSVCAKHPVIAAADHLPRRLIEANSDHKIFGRRRTRQYCAKHEHQGKLSHNNPEPTFACLSFHEFGTASIGTEKTINL